MISKQDRLDAITFAVVDIETTGFDKTGVDRVCEVAVVRGKLGQTAPLETWSTLVHPGRPIPFSATSVHHIDDAMVAGQPLFDGIAAALMSKVADTALIFHNGKFDLPFLQAELERHNFPKWNPEVVLDTCVLAQQNYKFENNKLGFLIEHLGLSELITPTHRALDDTISTWYLFRWLINDLRQQHSLETLEDLLALHKSKQAAKTAQIINIETIEIQSEQVTVSSDGVTVASETTTSTQVTFLQNFPDTQPHFEQWQNGEIPPEKLLSMLCQQFAYLDDISKQIDERNKILREQFSQIVAYLGGNIEIPQFGKLSFTEPQLSVSFDRKGLEKFMADLEANDNIEMAQAIAAYRTESLREGGLRINRNRPTKAKKDNL